jgi:hypothetical protein
MAFLLYSHSSHQFHKNIRCNGESNVIVTRTECNFIKTTASLGSTEERTGLQHVYFAARQQTTQTSAWVMFALCARDFMCVWYVGVREGSVLRAGYLNGICCTSVYYTFILVRIGPLLTPDLHEAQLNFSQKLLFILKVGTCPINK